MKRIWNCLFVLLSVNCFGQNLVPNPSFEMYSSCPSILGQVYKCQNWQTFGHTPDYFNICNTGVAGIPANNFGVQQASTGQAYCGLHNFFTQQTFREYLGAQLNQYLTVGQTYYVCLKVSLADDIQFRCATNKIGVKFSTVPFDTLNLPPLNNLSHVYASNIITDTLGWYTVKGNFIADSSYLYVMIGNFFDDANTLNNCTASSFDSYYYVDDVCVSLDSADCYSQTDLSFIPLNDIKFIIDVNKIIIQAPNNPIEEAEIKIYDLLGKILVNDRRVLSGSIEINLGGLSNSIYIISIKTNKIKQTFKFIKK